MYLSTAINDTPTIVGKAGAPMLNAAFHAAKFDAQGNIVPAAAGDNAIGLFVGTTPDVVAAGDDVTVQIKDVGLWVTGAAVLAGAEVASNAGGQAITAAANAFIVGIALETAAAPGAVIKVQIVKAGYKNGGAVAPLTLAGLTDVAIANIADGDAIVYDLATTKYVNKALDARIKDIKQSGRRKPNRLALGVDAFNALKNHPDIIERVKYTGSTANPAIVTTAALAAILQIEQVKVLESTYNRGGIGQEDMQFVCATDGALLCYATDNPAIDEPSAGYIFTWDMLGNGQYVAVDQFEGEKGTHSEFVEGLMSTDMKKTSDDLAIYFDQCV
jgi:hypothetical protein